MKYKHTQPELRKKSQQQDTTTRKQPDQSGWKKPAGKRQSAVRCRASAGMPGPLRPARARAAPHPSGSSDPGSCSPLREHFQVVSRGSQGGCKGHQHRKTQEVGGAAETSAINKNLAKTNYTRCLLIHDVAGGQGGSARGFVAANGHGLGVERRTQAPARAGQHPPAPGPSHPAPAGASPSRLRGVRGMGLSGGSGRCMRGGDGSATRPPRVRGAGG
jgi:hypothetical protein